LISYFKEKMKLSDMKQLVEEGESFFDFGMGEDGDGAESLNPRTAQARGLSKAQNVVDVAEEVGSHSEILRLIILLCH
jgi:hypothetical protein